jgi:hypothetical protein
VEPDVNGICVKFNFFRYLKSGENIMLNIKVTYVTKGETVVTPVNTHMQRPELSALGGQIQIPGFFCFSKKSGGHPEELR